MQTTLLIMAAGIGSRFGGGIKQLEPVDEQGHIIMDYSIHDAIEAGFNKVVFIIRKDIENEFNSTWNDLESVMKERGRKRRKNSKVTILQDLLAACVKLQSNSTYFETSENQRNDYIRDLLKTEKYDVKDQTRRGISAIGKSAGEVDILIEEGGLPVTIIEALNLDSLDTNYLDRHLDKVYRYDTVGNLFNII